MVRFPKWVSGVIAAFGAFAFVVGLIARDPNSIIFGIAGLIAGFIGLGWFMKRPSRPLSSWERAIVRTATIVMICVFVLLIIFHASSSATIGVTSFFLAVGFLMYLWFVVTRRSFL